MLLFDDSKKLEKALGEEAAAVLVHTFEKVDENWRRDFATKADIQILNDKIDHMSQGLRTEMSLMSQGLRAEMSYMATKVELQTVRNDLVKWMVGGFIAQATLTVAILGIAVMLFLK